MTFYSTSPSLFLSVLRASKATWERNRCWNTIQILNPWTLISDCQSCVKTPNPNGTEDSSKLFARQHFICIQFCRWDEWIIFARRKKNVRCERVEPHFPLAISFRDNPWFLAMKLWRREKSCLPIGVARKSLSARTITCSLNLALFNKSRLI